MKNDFSGMLRRGATQHNIPEDAILHTHLRENFKSYNVLPSSLIFLTLMIEAPSSSETSVLTRATRRNMPEDAILHSKTKSPLWCQLHNHF
jgi:hypothetical protein